MKRSNVRVITGALVSRVVIGGGRAVGVEYRRGGETRVLRARSEVILSGGRSTHPSCCSCLGSDRAGCCSQVSIPVVRDNANVGDHLSDHQGINYTWAMKVPTYNDELRPRVGQGPGGVAIFHRGRGRWPSRSTMAAVSSARGADLDRPNMQLYFQAFSTLVPREGERPLLTPDPWSGMSIGLSNCRPTSRGHIRLRSGRAEDHPVITANAFSTNNDVEEMLAAVNSCGRLRLNRRWRR